MAEWCFRPKQPGETIREPIHGEFFASDAISDPGKALVREGIQNALDAVADGAPVRVRIYLSGDEQAVPAQNADHYFASAWEHFQAPGNGLHPEGVPLPNSPCRFIAFEDFSTSGLEGDPTEAFKSPCGRKNHFYHFFRAEGQSDKEASDRGSWGVGKHVFLRSSQISTIFGLSVRAEDRQRLLMGKSVLKSHYVGEQYFQDGYFGIPPTAEQQLVLPVNDAYIIDEFASLFYLRRGRNEPGLSLVIPWPDPEITDAAIINAVLRDYFYPILSGQLQVIVETPSVQTILDSHTLKDEVGKLAPEIAGDLKSLIDLADWAHNLTDEDRIISICPDPEYAWQWSKSQFTDEQLASLRASYYAGHKLAVRVPVVVRKRTGETEASFFDIYLVRDGSEHSGRPTFIREGIIISEVDSPRTRGVRAIVVAHHTPLAGFLRRAENPSHTQWHYDRLKETYKYGYRKDLVFVKRSVYELVRILTEAEREEDPTLLADIFSIPAPQDEEEPVKTKHRKITNKSGSDPDMPDPPPPRPQRFRIQKVAGGFSVLPTNNDALPPERLDIRVAYDVRRGNPLNKYHAADFVLHEKPIQFDPTPRNVEIVECNGNRVVIDIKEPDFTFSVVGFDERRQLYVKAVAKEVTNGD